MSISTEKPQRWITALNNLVTLLRVAIRGTEEDYTAIPIRRAVLLLAIPMVLEMIMESVFGVVDMLFVARLGRDAVAAVGLTEVVLTVVYATAVGLSMAATAMIARRIGEKNDDGAATVAGQVLWLGAINAVVVGAIGIMFAPDLLRLMGASQDVVDQGKGFTTILLGGSATIFYLFLINAVFRGAGDASIAMRSLWLANGLNIVLDPCFIFGLGPFPELGVTGAAVATTIGRGVGVLYQLYCLFGRSGRLNVLLRHLLIAPRVLLVLIRVSTGGITQHLIAVASWILLMRIVSPYGSAAIAGFTIALRVIEFAFLPAWGMGNAAATLVGQNLGANKPERAENAVWQVARYNVIFLVSVALIFIGLADPLLRLFTDDPEVIAYGVDCLRLISYGYGFFAVGLVLEQAFNGAGDTLTPTIVNFFCYWLVQIPLAYWLAQILAMGPRGVFIAILVGESLIAVVAGIVFRRGYWKRKTI